MKKLVMIAGLCGLFGVVAVAQAAGTLRREKPRRALAPAVMAPTERARSPTLP